MKIKKKGVIDTFLTPAVILSENLSYFFLNVPLKKLATLKQGSCNPHAETGGICKKKNFKIDECLMAYLLMGSKCPCDCLASRYEGVALKVYARTGAAAIFLVCLKVLEV